MSRTQSLQLFTLERIVDQVIDMRRNAINTPAMAAQQPPWEADERLPFVRRQLRSRPALVRTRDVLTLRRQLAEVAAGRANVIQAGDCAENFADCTASVVSRKVGLLDSLAGIVRMNSGLPVIRVGRIAGQFAKPRSQPTELVGNCELPVYRGHMVNGADPDASAREPNPWRMLSGYHAAREAMRHLGWGADDGASAILNPRVWSSHEALLLDYERSMLRPTDEGSALGGFVGHGHPAEGFGDDGPGGFGFDGLGNPQHSGLDIHELEVTAGVEGPVAPEGSGLVLVSTHWPWVGERTRQLDGAHIQLLAGIINPIACKVGPTMGVDELLTLCERLDPYRKPGRLTLITRMGPEAIAERLPSLVASVRAAGHPVIWLTDPMHSNTVVHADGRKTREVETVVSEVLAFEAAVSDAGGTAAGLHLETTPDHVHECVSNPAERVEIRRYTSLCDPRLNPGQAATVAAAFGRGKRRS